ncbi:MAG: branched-chain amino acid ABC transporter permease [Solirubrobacteraceae bacterium]
MNELLSQLGEWRAVWRRRRAAWQQRLPSWSSRALAGILIVVGILFPFFFNSASGFLSATITALAYAVMALGLNIVVGFAGLLDLGYVAFYALGAYSAGWFGSEFFFKEHIHVLASPAASNLIGIHLNFVLILVLAIVITAAFGAIIGLPTLRLRGDYIAIVTLAFGEIVDRVAINGQSVQLGGGQTLTGGSIGISSIDPFYFPGLGTFDELHLRPWYWVIFAILMLVLFVNVRLRDSRLGRAWIALREDEVAAVSMGIPLVRTKLMAYAIGAAFGGMSGVFLATFVPDVSSDQFRFSFSIFILSMIIVGGLGSIWGVLLGALLLSYINQYLIPDVLNGIPSDLGLNFNLTDIGLGIYGFLLVLVMILRPQGLIPERRRKLELAEGIGVGETEMEGSQL